VVDTHKIALLNYGEDFFMVKKSFKIFIFTYILFSFLGVQIFAEFDAFNQVFEDQSVVPTIANVNDKTKGISELQSKSAILMDASTGQVLFDKNSHERLPLASVTKVMSLLLIMEALDSGRIKLDDKVTCSENAASMGGSQIFMEQGEQMTVNDLLKCVAVSSANDATVALAEFTYGSEEAFVIAMNEKAKLLGMKDTNFVNPTGLDADNHYSSAYDIALMSKELLMKHPGIHKYTTIWMDTVRNGEFGLSNTNNLVRFYKGCDGLKTGSTSKALFCVSETAVRNGFRLICVIMAAPSSKVRFAEASKLMDHGFASYNSVLVGKKGDIYGTIDVAKGIKNKVDCIVGEDIRILVKKGDESNVQRIVTLPTKVSAPIEKGQKIGEVLVKTKTKDIKKYDLIAKESIDKATIWRLFINMIKRLLNWK
jgi:D-alanyl-D-alanine carboxypeptidase (penicillin-binding protein 5/6)